MSKAPGLRIGSRIAFALTMTGPLVLGAWLTYLERDRVASPDAVVDAGGLPWDRLIVSLTVVLGLFFAATFFRPVEDLWLVIESLHVRNRALQSKLFFSKAGRAALRGLVPGAGARLVGRGLPRGRLRTGGRKGRPYAGGSGRAAQGPS